MAESNFDPYEKWLGIPPSERPIDHYRLLGVTRFEKDRELIGKAAAQRFAKIQGQAKGAFAPIGKQLLVEIEAAKLCLLSSGSRARYDNFLQFRQGPGSLSVQDVRDNRNLAGPVKVPAPIITPEPELEYLPDGYFQPSRSRATVSASIPRPMSLPRPEQNDLQVAIRIGTGVAIMVLLVAGFIFGIVFGRQTAAAVASAPPLFAQPEIASAPDQTQDTLDRYVCPVCSLAITKGYEFWHVYPGHRGSEKQAFHPNCYELQKAHLERQLKFAATDQTSLDYFSTFVAGSIAAVIVGLFYFMRA
jgi:hypothetical protein